MNLKVKHTCRQLYKSLFYNRFQKILREVGVSKSLKAKIKIEKKIILQI